MSQSSRSKRSAFEETDKYNSLSTSVQMAAMKLKSANKYIFRALLSIASAALLIRLMGMVNQVVVSDDLGQAQPWTHILWPQHCQYFWLN